MNFSAFEIGILKYDAKIERLSEDWGSYISYQISVDLWYIAIAYIYSFSRYANSNR